VSRVCEEFGCLPSQARAEMDQDADGLLWRVIEARRYERAKAVVEEGQAAGKAEHELPRSIWVRRVIDNQFVCATR